MNNQIIGHKLSIIRERCFKSFIYLGRVCFPSAFTSKSPPFHYEIEKMLMDYRVNTDCLIMSPRGTSKSTITSLAYVAWRIFERIYRQSNEQLYIVLVSETQPQAINFISRLKYHFSSSVLYQAICGMVFNEATSQRWRDDEIILADGTRIKALGAGQATRGLIEKDTRPTLYIVDDFESEHNANTRELRAKNRSWMVEAVKPSLADGGQLVVIGTPISEDCFLFWAKDAVDMYNKPLWNVQVHKIVDDQGNSIWPERFPLDRIERIKDEFAAMGRLGGFYQEYMMEPQSPEDKVFKPEGVRYYHGTFEQDANGNWFLVQTVNGEKRYKYVELYGGIDPASSLSEKADYFVIAIIAKDADDNIYLVDLFRDRINTALQPQKVIEMYKKWRPRWMKIETVGYQETLRNSVRLLMMQEKLYIPGLEQKNNPKNSKSNRLETFAYPWNAGKMFFRPVDTIAIGEFLSYNKGKHDDIMDAMYYAYVNTSKVQKNPEYTSYETKVIRQKKQKEVNWITL